MKIQVDTSLAQHPHYHNQALADWGEIEYIICKSLGREYSLSRDTTMRNQNIIQTMLQIISVIESIEPLHHLTIGKQ